MEIFGRNFLMILLFAVSLFAVEIKVNKEHILRGESVTLTITAEGENVKFPLIDKIGEYEIEAVSTSKNVITKNGKIFKTTSKYYTFTPLKSVIVPSFLVIVNGKKEFTKELKIDVKQDSVLGDKNFYLDMFINKKEAYVGEPLKLSIVFRKRIGVDIQDLDFKPPSFDDFWAKELIRPGKEITGSYVVQRIDYVLFPQRAGKLRVGSAVLNIGLPQRGEGIFNMIFNRISWKKIYSDPISIDVKALPQGVKVFGKFSMDVKTDKKEIAPNEALNLTVSIEGEGNVEDIEPFSLKIPKAAVYTDEPLKKGYFNKGVYHGSFVQKFAVVANESFTIPSFSFSYFDKDKKRVQILKSDPIKVKVKGSSGKTDSLSLQKSFVEKKNRKEGIDKTKFYIFSAIAFVMGVLIGFSLKNVKFKKRTQKPISLQKKIKEAKNDKELLETLLPYVDRSKEIEEIVFALEGNLYNGGNYKIDKKNLAKNIESYLKGKNQKEEFEELI